MLVRENPQWHEIHGGALFLTLVALALLTYDMKLHACR
jgi:hypothetical protein